MNRVMIIGFSGSGKSTLAGQIAKIIRTEPTYMDTLNFLPGWVETSREYKREKLAPILERDKWVIDGSYRQILYKERVEKADTIIFMDFNRFRCLARVIKRRIMWHGKSRPDITQGCNEKIDFEFLKWVVWEGRRKRPKFYRELEEIRKIYDDAKRIYIFKRPGQVQDFLDKLSKGMNI